MGRELLMNGVKVAGPFWIKNSPFLRSLPWSESLKVYTKDNHTVSKVSDLILPTNDWNHGIIDTIFLPIDVEIIKAIPLAISNREDDLIWHFDRKGVFSVKSCYAMC